MKHQLHTTRTQLMLPSLSNQLQFRLPRFLIRQSPSHKTLSQTPMLLFICHTPGKIFHMETGSCVTGEPDVLVPILRQEIQSARWDAQIVEYPFPGIAYVTERGGTEVSRSGVYSTYIIAWNTQLNSQWALINRQHMGVPVPCFSDSALDAAEHRPHRRSYFL